MFCNIIYTFGEFNAFISYFFHSFYFSFSNFHSYLKTFKNLPQIFERHFELLSILFSVLFFQLFLVNKFWYHDNPFGTWILFVWPVEHFHFVFMVILFLFILLFIVFSIHVIDTSTSCWNLQRAVCDICRCLLGAAPCFPRLTSALPDGSRETHRAAQDGNTGFSSWGACSLREMRWGILSLFCSRMVHVSWFWGDHTGVMGTDTWGQTAFFVAGQQNGVFKVCVKERERAVEERAC